MKNLFLFLLLTLMACGQKTTSKTSKIHPPGLPETITLGLSSTAEVKNELGEPSAVYSVNKAIIYSYKNQKSIKLGNNVAKAFYRNPEKNETYLQYWLQLWKDKKTIQEKIIDSKNIHGKYDYQMICPEDNTTIIFDNENGIVKRVMYYEK